MLILFGQVSFHNDVNLTLQFIYKLLRILAALSVEISQSPAFEDYQYTSLSTLKVRHPTDIQILAPIVKI
jgi:hypothetical protein